MGTLDPLTIIDTDILIEFSRGDNFAADRLDEAEAKSILAVSVITEMELIVGCRDKIQRAQFREFLGRFQILNINDQISVLASELIDRYNLSHGLLIPDALIAATALTLDEEFVTRNQRDFRFIEQLKLLPYS